MIHYSSYPDLYKVMEMFSTMSQKDKKFLFFDNNEFFIKLTKLHYKLIKGQCLMLVNEEGITIGFVSLDLTNDTELFITEMYVDPKYRVGSLSILLEMFAQLKLYVRPIYFVSHIDNVGMHNIAKFIKAIRVAVKDDSVKYVIHI